MRTLLIAGNWKMNLDRSGAVSLARAVKNSAVAAPNGSEIMLAPPYPYLGAVREVLEGSPLILAGQDVSAHEKGAFTGDVSAGMLLDTGCRYTLVGHSERRVHGGDSDAVVSAKVRRALDAGLGVVLCVGELEEERENGEQEPVVGRQLNVALEGVSEEIATDRLVVAYEPVWAIGTGRTATSADAQAMHAFVRRVLAKRYSDAAASRIRILYGGSVKPSNAGELLGAEDIDGVLVGGASLDAESFTAIYAAGVPGKD